MLKSCYKVTIYNEHYRPDHQSKRMTYFDYDAILDLKDGDILFLDELLNANPMILNAFLTVLEDRILPSGKRLADIMIVAAGNPQGAASLTPQIKERFIFYEIAYNEESWKQYMSKYQVTDSIFSGLSTLVKSEAFLSSEKNYISPRSIDKALNMMIKGVYTPYEKKLNNVVNMLIENTTPGDIQLGDYTFKVGEKMKWLDIQRKLNNIKNNEATTK